MKKVTLSLIFFILLLTSCQHNQQPQKLSKYDRIDLAMKQEQEKTRNPYTGIVEREKLIEAHKYMQAYQKELQLRRSSIPGVTWNERGPNNIGGRTRAILYDLNDPSGNTVFAAGVSGGLWKCSNINNATPIWTAVNDFFDNLAISSIAQDPTNPQIIYFGTGEGYFNIDAVRGNGIWKSTDGGNTFTQLSSTNNDNNFHYVNDLVVTSTGTLIASCRSIFCNRGGIFRSTNQGASFVLVENGNYTSGCNNPWAADLSMADDGTLFGTFGIFYGDGIYKSTDDGANWTQVYTASSDEARIEVAVAPNNSNIVYALIQEDDNTIKSIIKSTNGGVSWSFLSNPSWQDQCSPSTDFTRGQAFYNLAITVNPTDADELYIGGIDLLKSTNGGTSFTQISEWANCSSLEDVHADQHAIVFKPGSSTEALIGNDGGVYQSTNMTNTSPSFTHKVNDYNVTQYYSCAMSPTSARSYFLGGSQDNGSHKFTTGGINSVTEVTGGDGGFCHIDQTDENYQFTSYTNNNIYRSSDGGNTFSLIIAKATGKFINPSDYDNDASILYMGGSPGNIERWNNPNSGNSVTVLTGAIGGSEQVSAITCDPNTSNRIWIGTDAGRLYRMDNANATPSLITIGHTGFNAVGGYISCIAIEDGDADHLLVTFSNYGVSSVWETTNGGISWTNVEGNLPDIPVRWALFSPLNSNQAMLATELGVWTTTNINAGSTDWQPSVNGLANVRTDMLQIRSSDNVVLAATHGRGMFTSDVFASAIAEFSADETLSYGGVPIQFIDGSVGANSWLWDFGDGKTSTDQNPVHTYTTDGVYNVSLKINGGTIAEYKASYIHILPNKGVPYTLADGGNFESNIFDFGTEAEEGVNIWELGIPTNSLSTPTSGTNVWKTDLDGDIGRQDIKAYLYTPNFNVSVPGTYAISFNLSMESRYINAPYALQVQYSTDSGLSWNRLGSDNDINGTNWYFQGPSSAFQIDASIFSDGMGWLNPPFGSHAVSYDISSLAGNQNLSFRFAFHVSSIFTDDDGYARDGYLIDDFQISGPATSPTPLPVELVSFSGEALENNNQLHWSTSSEVNNHGFEVHKSDGNNSFNLIGFVNGMGNSVSLNQYRYIDNNVRENISYYKLKQIDFDGNFEWSNTIAIKRSEFDFLVYPNPFIDYIQIKPESLVGNTYEIYNLQGELITKGILATEKLNLSSLSKGSYILSIKVNGERLVKHIYKG